MKSIVEQSFELILKVMTLFGLYPSENTSVLFRVRTYVLYIFLLVLGSTATLIKTVFQGGNDMQVLYHMVFASNTFAFNFKLFPFFRNGERIKKCINYFGDPKFTPGTLHDEKLTKECIQFCRIISNCFFVGIILCETFWILPMILKKQLPLEAWLPYDPTVNPLVFYATFFYYAAVVVYGGFAGCMIDPLIGGLAYHATTQLKILKNKLQHLDLFYTTNFKEEFSEIKFECLKNALKNCIDHHNSILNFVAEYEQCFSFPVFCEFAGSMFAMCFCCIGIMTNRPGSLDFIESGVFFFFIMFQIFFYCFFGTLLIDENDGFIDAIYMGSWYRYDVRIRKILIIMMERSKIPMVVSAGKVVDITLKTFLAVLKSSSSLIAVFNKY